MTEEWINVFVTWFPMLLLIAVFVWFTSRFGRGTREKGPSGSSLIELYEQQVMETRKMNTTLERIAVALEKRANQTTA